MEKTKPFVKVSDIENIKSNDRLKHDIMMAIKTGKLPTYNKEELQ